MAHNFKLPIKFCSVFISENHPINVGLAYFSVRDGDLNNRGPMDVKLIMGDEYFSIYSGFLVLETPLDRETQNFVNVIVSACDSGSPKKCSTTEINFIITGEIYNS